MGPVGEEDMRRSREGGMDDGDRLDSRNGMDRRDWDGDSAWDLGGELSGRVD
jgi:hypothetical protein